MQFLMLINGPQGGKATVNAIENRGLCAYWHGGKNYKPCTDEARQALPYRWRKAFDRATLWTREDSARRFQCIFATLNDRKGRYLATVYFQPKES